MGILKQVPHVIVIVPRITLSHHQLFKQINSATSSLDISLLASYIHLKFSDITSSPQFSNISLSAAFQKTRLITISSGTRVFHPDINDINSSHEFINISSIDHQYFITNRLVTPATGVPGMPQAQLINIC